MSLATDSYIIRGPCISPAFGSDIGQIRNKFQCVRVYVCNSLLLSEHQHRHAALLQTCSGAPSFHVKTCSGALIASFAHSPCSTALPSSTLLRLFRAARLFLAAWLFLAAFPHQIQNPCRKLSLPLRIFIILGNTRKKG